MPSNKQKYVGLIVGHETKWPEKLIHAINQLPNNVSADLVKIDAVTMDNQVHYDLIVDRMSHRVPFYRHFTKFAAVNGTYIMNNPFTWATDDKFFGIALARKLDVKLPRTVILPNKRVNAELQPNSFRNLRYPMQWDEIIQYVGVPAIFKDAHTEGRQFTRRVHNVDELIEQYDMSDTRTMILQQIIPSETHIHAYVIGQKTVNLLPYAHEKYEYLPKLPPIPKALKERITHNALTLTQAYDYDINMVEFVLHENEAYLINPSNPVPEMDILPEPYFQWSIDQTIKFILAELESENNQFRNYKWFNQF